ncbi:MAG: hypothetical protein J6Z31_03095 [Fibrobacter sp.]|nr:hypothetical protein [Fibrobacter sp.]
MGAILRHLIFFSTAIAILVGCSDTTSSVDTQTSAASASQITQSGYDLGSCTADKIGLEILVYEEMAYYICTKGGMWTRITVKDYMASNENSSASSPSSSSVIASEAKQSSSSSTTRGDSEAKQSSSSSSRGDGETSSSSAESNVESSSSSSVIASEAWQSSSSSTPRNDSGASSSSQTEPIFSSSSEAVSSSSSTFEEVVKISSASYAEFFFSSSSAFHKCNVNISLGKYNTLLALVPNDYAAQDSAEHRLANTGAYLRILPGASYTLSFDKVKEQTAPVLLISSVNQKYSIGAVDSVGRWFYSFTLPSTSKNTLTSYYTALYNANDCSTFNGKTSNVHLSGFGNYSTHFNINLIIMGKYMGTSDEISAEAFAKALHERFNLAFAESDIHVDKVNLLYASDHPKYGSSYSDDEPYVLTASLYNSDYSEISQWSGHEKALDIILGYYISKANILGFAPRFGAALNGNGSGYSYVIVGTHYKNDLTSSTVYSQTSDAILETIVHESGHYFGLRHTSSSISDMSNDFDRSNVEDGLKDTPYCAAINTSYDYVNCKDRYNLVFPYATDGYADDSYTADQLELIRKNLMLMEH